MGRGEEGKRMKEKGESERRKKKGEMWEGKGVEKWKNGGERGGKERRRRREKRRGRE